MAVVVKDEREKGERERKLMGQPTKGVWRLLCSDQGLN
jgi:hypothetical protein